MLIPSSFPAHLTYCLNVHPGESLSDQLGAIRTHATKVRDAVAPGQRFGLGLRLSNAASLELANPAEQKRFRDSLSELNMYAFTVNGFPFGAFHEKVVKENVYRPDWRSIDRVQYTKRLGDELCGILPDGLGGSISTVPCSYKSWIKADDDVKLMAMNLADVAAHFSDIEARTGKEIHLGLEPEPDCYLETTGETVAFFENHLIPSGSAHLAGRGMSLSDAERVLRKHVGVCFDTCHLAMQFEDLCGSLEQFRAHGIRVSKIQISAAIEVTWDVGAAEALEPFCDPVYLHQVKQSVGGRVIALGDLQDALRRGCSYDKSRWRIHCHIPLHFEQSNGLRSTSSCITEEFFAAALRGGVEHFEIETYTFNVLPASMRAQGLDASIADEFRWVQARWPRQACGRSLQ